MRGKDQIDEIYTARRQVLARLDMVYKDPTPPVEMDEGLRRLWWATGD